MVETVRLSNGVRVVMADQPCVRSVSVGVWVNTGSVRETESLAGASHFIEHMVFKGTGRRSAARISAEVDAVGGTLNAFTSKECTCFYARVLDEHLPLAVDILSDIVLHSRFDPADIEREKQVVGEEILMNEDTPEDLSAEKAAGLFFQGDPLARPILGYMETVSAFSREDILAYMEENYTPGNIVIACAGSFRRDELIDLLEKRFDISCSGSVNQRLTSQRPSGLMKHVCVEKNIEQVHITLGLPGCGRQHADRYALNLISNALGGSMSSRLFQTIREERGLAYSVYSYPSCYTSAGAMGVYAGTSAEKSVETLSLMIEEIERMRSGGITEEEFVRCREQMKGNYLLGMESTGALMNAIGRTELLQGRQYDAEDTLRRISDVSMEDVRRCIAEYLRPDRICAAIVGRTKGKRREFDSILSGVRS